MEAELKINLTSGKPIKEVLREFFDKNSPDSSWAYFILIMQCWTMKDCKIKAEISDEELALFFDQLTDLVAAAYILHQANRASKTAQEGSEHE